MVEKARHLCIAGAVLTVVLTGAVLAGLAEYSAPAPAPAKAPTSSDFSRYKATSSVQTSFSLAAGPVLKSTVAADHEIRALGNSAGGRRRGIKLRFFGSGADNATFDYRVWLVERMLPVRTGQDEEVILSLYAYGTATLSTSTGLASSTIVTSSERFADTLTWTVTSDSATPKGNGTMIEATMGVVSDKYSPADNTPAEVMAPDLGNAAYLVIEFDLTGATGANALVQDDT